MEPISILIWVSIVFIIIIGILLTVILVRLVRILTTIDRILEYIGHIRDLIQMWETWPIELAKKFLSKLIDYFFVK